MAKAEAKSSDDCSDIWNFDGVSSTLISEHFSLNTGDSWKKERSAIKGSSTKSLLNRLKPRRLPLYIHLMYRYRYNNT